MAKNALRIKHKPRNYLPGITPVPVTGKYFGHEEIENAFLASADFWLTSGPYSEKFESKFDDEVYDTFYSKYYDNIHENKDRDVAQLKIII